MRPQPSSSSSPCPLVLTFLAQGCWFSLWSGRNLDLFFHWVSCWARTVRSARAVFSLHVLKRGTGNQGPGECLPAPWWDQAGGSTRNYSNVKPLLCREWYLLKGHENIKPKEFPAIQDIIRLFHSSAIKFRSLSKEISTWISLLIFLLVQRLGWTRRAAPVYGISRVQITERLWRQYQFLNCCHPGNLLHIYLNKN